MLGRGLLVAEAAGVVEVGGVEEVGEVDVGEDDRGSSHALRCVPCMPFEGAILGRPCTVGY